MLEKTVAEWENKAAMVDRKQKYTVKEFAALCDVSPRTLKYYESCGLFEPAGRFENGYRYYLLDQTDDLLTIRLYQDYGYDLDTIRSFVHPENLEEYRKALGTQQDMTARQIRRLVLKKQLAAWKEKEITNAINHENQAFLGTINRRITLNLDLPKTIDSSVLSHLSMSGGIIWSASSGKPLASYAPDAKGQVLMNGDCMFLYVRDREFNPKNWIRTFLKEADRLSVSCTKICMEPIVIQNASSESLLRLFAEVTPVSG